MAESECAATPGNWMNLGTSLLACIITVAGWFTKRDETVPVTVLNELRNSVVRERGQWNEERKRLAEEWGEERKRWDEERKRVAEERVEERKDMNLEKANWRDSLEQARLLCESRMDALWKNAEEERGRMLGWWREEMEKEKQEIREGMEREREGWERERVGWERERKGWESERSALRVHLSLPRERSLNDGGEA